MDTLIQPMEAALNQTTFLTQAQALLGKAISEHTTQRNVEVKSIINKDLYSTILIIVLCLLCVTLILLKLCPVFTFLQQLMTERL